MSRRLEQVAMPTGVAYVLDAADAVRRLVATRGALPVRVLLHCETGEMAVAIAVLSPPATSTITSTVPAGTRTLVFSKQDRSQGEIRVRVPAEILPTHATTAKGVALVSALRKKWPDAAWK